jgi:hypothetical protein
LPSPFDKTWVSVNQKSGPAVVDDEVGAVALYPVPSADFDHCTIRHAKKAKQVQEDPILAVLREDTELHLRDWWHWTLRLCERAVGEETVHLNDLATPVEKVDLGLE